jgi:hypothetical protein
MDLMFDKNFHLVTFVIIASYIYLKKPECLGKINILFTHTVFIFLGIFYLYYRITYEVDTAFIISVLFILILKCMENYEENFIDENLLTINFYDKDSIILNEESYKLDGKNKIPDMLLKNISKMTSFKINPNYFITISNNGSQEQVYRGEFVIQTKNPFTGVTSINIFKN